MARLNESNTVRAKSRQRNYNVNSILLVSSHSLLLEQFQPISSRFSLTGSSIIKKKKNLGTKKAPVFYFEEINRKQLMIECLT